MFKWVGLIGLCCWSLSSFAAFPGRAGAFKGGGTWKMTNGATGTWSSEMTISKETSGGINVKETLTIALPQGAQEVESVEWSAAPTTNDFFDISIDGQKKGMGVCFGETCQIKMDKAGDDSFVELFHFSGDQIFRQGLDLSSADKIAWDGVMAQ